MSANLRKETVMRIRSLALGLLATLPAPAIGQGWDGVREGKITAIEAPLGNGNFDFRVHMDGQPVCGPGTTSWGYMNTAAPNYQVVSALLMSASMSGRTVTLYTYRRGSSYCEIGHIFVRAN